MKARKRNILAHQRREDLVGDLRLLDIDLEQRPDLWVHRRRPQLLRIHLTETFVPLDPDLHRCITCSEFVDQGVALIIAERIFRSLPSPHLIQRRLGDVDVPSSMARRMKRQRKVRISVRM